MRRRVALDFAAWCRHPDYLVDDIEGDAAAPARAVDALHAFFENANVERRSVTPQSLGVSSVGHFGFFRERVGGRVWAELVEWLQKARQPVERGRS